MKILARMAYVGGWLLAWPGEFCGAAEAELLFAFGGADGWRGRRDGVEFAFGFE